MGWLSSRVHQNLVPRLWVGSPPASFCLNFLFCGVMLQTTLPWVCLCQERPLRQQLQPLSGSVVHEQDIGPREL